MKVPFDNYWRLYDLDVALAPPEDPDQGLVRFLYRLLNDLYEWDEENGILLPFHNGWTWHPSWPAPKPNRSVATFPGRREYEEMGVDCEKLIEETEFTNVWPFEQVGTHGSAQIRQVELRILQRAWSHGLVHQGLALLDEAIAKEKQRVDRMQGQWEQDWQRYKQVAIICGATNLGRFGHRHEASEQITQAKVREQAIKMLKQWEPLPDDLSKLIKQVWKLAQSFDVMKQEQVRVREENRQDRCRQILERFQQIILDESQWGTEELKRELLDLERSYELDDELNIDEPAMEELGNLSGELYRSMTRLPKYQLRLHRLGLWRQSAERQQKRSQRISVARG